LNTNVTVPNLALHGTFGGISGAGNLTITQTLDWTAGFMTGAGKTTLPALSVSTMSGPDDKTLSRDLDLFGTLNVNNSGSTIFAINSNTLRVLPGGLLDLRFAAIVDNDSGTPGNLIIDGIVRKSGINETASIGGRTTGTGSVNITLNSGGRVEVVAGPLDFRGNGTNTSAGVFDVTNAGNTNLVFNVPFTLNAGTAITGAGRSVIANNVTLTVAAPVNASGRLALNTGTLTLAAPLTQTGTFEWNGGTISGASAANLAALSIDTNTVKALDAATINLSGVGTWIVNSGFAMMQGAVFNIQNGAIFDVQTNATIVIGAGAAPAINNAGTYKKTAGGGASAIAAGIAFTNTGTVSAENGTITFQGSFDQTGGTTVLAGGGISTQSVLNFSGGELRGPGRSPATFQIPAQPCDPAERCTGTLAINNAYTQGAGGTLAD
jgi:hypothetical protein